MKKERSQPEKTKAKAEPNAPAQGVRAPTARPAKASAQRRRKATLQDLLDQRRRLFDAVHQLSAERLAIVLAEPHIDINHRDGDGMTVLHHAAAKGARPCLRLLVASGKCDYLIRDNQGRYPFELAIEWARDYAVARLLMKKQAQQAHRQGVPAYVPRAAAQP